MEGGVCANVPFSVVTSNRRIKVAERVLNGMVSLPGVKYMVNISLLGA